MTNVDTRLQNAIDLLLRLGWTRESRVEDRYEVWSLGQGRREAILPLDSHAGDYQPLLERLLRTIRASDTSRFDALQREIEVLTSANLALVQWHKETALPPGLVSWEGGEQLHIHAREQLAASAKAAVEKRRYHGNRSSHVAASFLGQTYMGAPEAASFVVSALSPRNARHFVSKAAESRASSSPERLLDPEVVTGIEVLNTYDRALNALRAGLDQYAQAPTLEPLLEGVSDGVSFEMTRSLEAILSGGDAEISVYLNSRSQASTQIEFKAAESAVLARATTALAQDTEPRSVTLTGEVTLLKREIGTGDRLIRLDVQSGDPDARRARIRLTPEQYEQAIEAHRSEGGLEVSGTLVREGNLFWMYEVSSMSVVGLDPSEASNENMARETREAIQDDLTNFDQ